MRVIFATLAMTGLLAACATTPEQQAAAPVVHTAFAVEGGAADADKLSASAMVEAGRTRIETYFGRPFPETPRIVLAANRAEFNAAFPADWGMSETQCWMVGVGVADFLAVLAQSSWATDACDHNANDPTEAQQIITHELTHSFHAQLNPTRDFTGMDDLGWFVEGLAVVVSGQLEARRASAAEAIAADAAPTSLANAWSGRYRYGVCGSLVQYIDQTYGRAKVIALLAATTQQQALDLLDVSEVDLLANWRAWVLSGAA